MSFRHLSFILLVALEFGCQKKAAEPPPRYAVLRFENLASDASLDWVGRAASETLSVSLSGAMDGPVLSSAAVERLAPALGARPASAPGISSERAAALLAGANRVITGYVERAPGNGIRIVAIQTNLLNGKVLRTATAEASGAMPALSELAKAIAPAAKPYSTSNAAAFEQYFAAFESPLNTSRSELHQAVTADPNFGPAWLSLARVTAASGDREGAAKIVQEAKTHPLDPLTHANLDVEQAGLAGDQSGRIAALRKVSTLSPGDSVLLRSLAEAETAAGQFETAAVDWNKLADITGNDPVIWNSLGYARSYAGDFSGALAAFQQYAKLRPNDANVLDSEGDLYYSYRKYSDAAAAYREANAKDASLLRSGDLYKAAWARFSAGDKAGADVLFGQFRAERDKSAELMTPLISADWLYRTGRQQQAVELLRKTVQDAKSPQLRAESYSQLAIWDLIAGDRTKAAQDAAASGQPTSAPMALMRFAAQPSVSPAEWQTRAERLLPAPGMAPLRRLALGYALLLDGKREAALPVWEEIVKTTPATDFLSRAIAAKLQGKEPERPLLPDPNTVNQFSALVDKL